MDTFTYGDKAPATRQTTGSTSDDVALLSFLRSTRCLVMDALQGCVSARLPS